MRSLGVLIATLFGAAAGMALAMLAVFACAAALDISDTGAQLAVLAVICGSIVGAVAGFAITARRRGPPSPPPDQQGRAP